MQSERIGKAYEALLKVVLDQLHDDGSFCGNVFWNETPEGISVEPDFSIGESKDIPIYVIMVTHIVALHASEKKSWRNIGEVCEIKTVLETMPIAISIVFDSLIKEDLKRLQAATFDQQLLVGDLEYGRALRDWVVHHEEHLPTDQYEKAITIKALSNVDTELKNLLIKLKRDVRGLFHSPSFDKTSLWSMEKNRKKPESRSNKITAVRRGLSKLLVFEDIDLGIRLYREKSVTTAAVPDYIYSVGLAKKGIGKAIAVDEEIKNAVSLLSDQEIRMLYHSVDGCDTLQSWIGNLRYIANVDFMGQYISNEYESLIDPDEFYARIQELHSNPLGITSEYAVPDTWPPSDVWLVSYTIELLKAASKRATGYGISQLGFDVVDAGFGTQSDLANAGQFGGGFGFSAWLMRKKSPFRDDLVEGVAYVLSQKLKELGAETIKKTAKTCLSAFVKSTIDTKICTYRNFFPLPLLLINSGIAESMDDTIRIRSCFSEYGGLGGSTGVTTVFHCKNTVINWQTATDSGKDHKRKELCGRALSIRYTWNSNAGVFEQRKRVKKLILLLDGTWRQKDLDALIRAGWDEIYYPDELDKLKAAIV